MDFSPTLQPPPRIQVEKHQAVPLRVTACGSGSGASARELPTCHTGSPESRIHDGDYTG